MELDKWYLDVVDERGRAAILYHLTVRCGPLAWRLAAAMATDPGGVTRERATFRGGPAPQESGPRGVWRNRALGASCEWAATTPSFERRLLDTRAGHIMWRCVAPAACVSLRVGREQLEGAGYVERLRVSIPLSSLPIEELRWGRFVGADLSLVWLQWRGPVPFRLALLDGCEVELIDAGDLAVVVLLSEGARELRLADTRVVRSGLVRESLGPFRRPAAWLAPGIAVAREEKRLSRGAWTRTGQSSDHGSIEPSARGEGWAVHEVVTFGAC